MFSCRTVTSSPRVRLGTEPPRQHPGRTSLRMQMRHSEPAGPACEDVMCTFHVTVILLCYG
jgi:hypothetical protein